MSVKTLVVVGSGPGIGVTTASLFASKGFKHIALLSRNSDRLENDAKVIAKAAADDARIDTYSVNVADQMALRLTLKRVEADLGPPEVVFFNVGIVAASIIGELTAEELLEDFKVTNIGLYVTATWAFPHLTRVASPSEASYHPCFFISGSGIHENPSPSLFSMSMMKAAQFSFAGSLIKQYRLQGVHTATVVIGGRIDPNSGVFSPRNIANQFWILYQQEKWEWQDKIDVENMRDHF